MPFFRRAAVLAQAGDMTPMRLFLGLSLLARRE